MAIVTDRHYGPVADPDDPDDYRPNPEIAIVCAPVQSRGGRDQGTPPTRTRTRVG